MATRLGLRERGAPRAPPFRAILQRLIARRRPPVRRKFVKDFAPSIKYHNEGVKFENVKEWKTVPELSLDMADGTVETVDVTGVDQEGILNMVLEADKRGTAQTTASDKPETTTFFGKEIEL